MKNEKFMNQKMKDMSVKELAKAILIKQKQNMVPASPKEEQPTEVTSLKYIEPGSIVVFNDNAAGMVVCGRGVEKKYTDSEKAVFLLRNHGGCNWGDLARGLLDDFKRGNYKKIIPPSECKIKIEGLD